MNLNISSKKRGTRNAFALILVIVFAGVMMLLLGSVLSWTSNSAQLINRNNLFVDTISAAESATEKVISYMVKDYYDEGSAVVDHNLTSYRAMVPLSSEDGYWGNFSFYDADGASGAITVEQTAAAQFTELESQYSGLYGLAATYDVTSYAQNELNKVEAGVRQVFKLASIPVFQFAIFYSIDMEFHNGPNMTINGKVHGNSDLYIKPDGSTLTFQDDVTAVGGIYNTEHPDNPGSKSGGSIVYQAEHDSGVSSLTLPVGSDNSPAAVHEILEIPPLGESATSDIGRLRYYNTADIVIVVEDSSITASTGLFNSFGTTLPQSDIDAFVSTDKYFYDQREKKTMLLTEINVENLNKWISTNATFSTALPSRPPRSIYVADNRTANSSNQPAIRVTEGAELPSMGLTIATPNPLYVQGHYNAPTSTERGSHNTANTKPASLVADAITVLSENWNDSKAIVAGLSLSGRSAKDTTVNAAFLTGIVPSDGSNYSGGVENFPRLLESWSGKKLTYNGSMVAMFYSQTATGKWSYGGYNYTAPGRDWAFDVNFLDSSKLPPATPEVRTIIRGTWDLAELR